MDGGRRILQNTVFHTAYTTDVGCRVGRRVLRQVFQLVVEDVNVATIGKILYATDFSKLSLAALPLAVDLAKRYDAQLYCVHVLNAENELFLEGGYMTPVLAAAAFDIAELKQRVQIQLDQFVAEHIGDAVGSVKKSLLLGKPFVEIIRYARTEGIDLIVLGTHGRSAIASMLLGSVAEKVVRGAPCAVLTVRHPEQQFVAP